MDSCKFCGHRLSETYGLCDTFVCGTDHEHVACKGGTWTQSEACEEICRFRAMFPVLPWSKDPITRDTCDALGFDEMSQDWWRHNITEDIHVYVSSKRSNVELHQDGDEDFLLTTMKAGQLACLVAARRNNGKH